MAGFDIHHNGVDVIEERVQNELPSGTTNLTEFIYENQKVNFKYVLKPGIEIFYVRKNSVADKAGLKVSDKIISINKKKATNYKLTDIIEIFHKNANETVIVEIERKGKIIVVELLLKEEI